MPSNLKKFNWIQIIDGDLLLKSKSDNKTIYLKARDGLGVEILDIKKIFLETKKGVDFLLFSMPIL